MNKTSYFIRLDDASPYIDNNKWDRIISILEKHKIHSLIGVIPDNKDSLTIKESYYQSFWQKAKEWERYGHVIALHGYDHCYVSTNGGINPIHNRSEFAGIPIGIQKEKIKKGYHILLNNGLTPIVFYAPSHTFDENTIKALIEETPIRIISDTIALKSYKAYGVTFIPQQIGQFKDIPISGNFTFCFHPNNMTDEDFAKFEQFIIKNRDKFYNYSELIAIATDRKRNIFETILQQSYYLMHKLRK